MEKKTKNTGKCNLTGDIDAFVKSHIIPKGLIPKTYKNIPFMQPLAKGKSKKVHHGYYDSNIVTRKGEDILAELDSWAISNFREKKLVWTGWGNDNHLEDEGIDYSKEEVSIRKISNINTNTLRIFCLSLLWRASLSELPDLQHIKIPRQDIEKIRKIILSKKSSNADFYPIMLTQFHTREIGNTHLIVPHEDILVMEIKKGKPIKLPFYRFYFDGLIIQIYTENTVNHSEYFSSLVVGYDNNLTLLTRKYEGSREQLSYESSLENHVNEFIKSRGM